MSNDQLVTHREFSRFADNTNEAINKTNESINQLGVSMREQSSSNRADIKELANIWRSKLGWAIGLLCTTIITFGGMVGWAISEANKPMTVSLKNIEKTLDKKAVDDIKQWNEIIKLSKDIEVIKYARAGRDGRSGISDTR